MAIQQPKRIKRPLNGMLLLDKPQGGSSNQVLQKVKYLYAAQKAGHTGALDPLASGMLPICFGETTKFAQFLLDSDKRYRVTIQLGIRTDTSDAEGKVVSQRSVNVTELQLQRALLAFQGELQQIPTMFSALKHQGRPLYEYARQGLVIERAPRAITVYEIICHDFTGETLDLEIHCSKGTYIRTIADDLGELLGCGGHVTALRRLQVSDYPIENMVTLPQLLELSAAGGWESLDNLLLPLDSPVKKLPKLLLESNHYQRMQHGNSVKLDIAVASRMIGTVRLFNAEGCGFLGVGSVDAQGNLVPQRLVTQP